MSGAPPGAAAPPDGPTLGWVGHSDNFGYLESIAGPLREVIPVGPERVHVRLPEGVRPTRVRLLTSGLAPPVDVSGGVLTVTVPSIEVHEVIAIDV